jgi:hypothetical protein
LFSDSLLNASTSSSLNSTAPNRKFPGISQYFVLVDASSLPASHRKNDVDWKRIVTDGSYSTHLRPSEQAEGIDAGAVVSKSLNTTHFGKYLFYYLLIFVT